MILAVAVGGVMIVRVSTSSSWWRVGQWVGWQSSPDDVVALRARIAALEEQVATAYMGILRPAATSSLLSAKVFSIYPFNQKSRLFLAVGSADGVAIGDAVSSDGSVLVGRVITVYPHASEVMTIFDRDFSLAVRVGSHEVDGLLQGGVTPRVVYSYNTTSSAVSEGDTVVSADKSYPFGMVVGSARSFQEDRSGTFFDSEVIPAYVMRDLKTVFILPAPIR